MKVENGQSVFDIAIQCCGSIESALEIAAVNGISITDTIVARELQTPEMVSKKVADYYAINALQPATDITDDQEVNNPTAQGIEFWTIEQDFVIM